MLFLRLPLSYDSPSLALCFWLLAFCRVCLPLVAVCLPFTTAFAPYLIACCFTCDTIRPAVVHEYQSALTAANMPLQFAGGKREENEGRGSVLD